MSRFLLLAIYDKIRHFQVENERQSNASLAGGTDNLRVGCPTITEALRNGQNSPCYSFGVVVYFKR
ncbi:MAG: hypothetical protein ONB44_01650 [candidate division KSB1 bacterium]|nr:hypothetical protein [candidate division KSB1 bacterium]MDZ7300825.1 hypothetical protein [candidate division KSB1 bacterium]MDZ7309904.1 hypothetical protein [candidate division KSB1 bacterium]